MTATVTAQMEMFEQSLKDDHLLTLLDDLEQAKAEVENAKGYLADYAALAWMMFG